MQAAARTHLKEIYPARRPRGRRAIRVAGGILACSALACITIGAIVMAESWFGHRAVNENPWGNRDIGLAQCSDHCREGIAEMAANGEIAFAPTEADYFIPWIATRSQLSGSSASSSTQRETWT